MSVPLPRLSPRPVLMSAAACSMLSTRKGAAQPLRRVKKAGNSSVPRAATLTPCRASARGVLAWCCEQRGRKGCVPSLPHFPLQVLSPCEGGYSLCFGRFVPKAVTVQSQGPVLDNDSCHTPRYLGI